MTETAVEQLVALGVRWPPTQDDLPCDDGMPMETQRHVMQLQLLMDPLRLFWTDRQDVYVGGNMFVYFSLEQVRNQDLRGPDFFAVLDVPRRERKSWVVWEEGKGPDVVIELLSESTAARDKGEKKDVYQNCLRVPEYFWFDPFSAEWAGFALREGVYEPIAEDAQGWLISQRLGLALMRWDGAYHEVSARWLRWATLEGTLLPTPQEAMEQKQRRADEAQRYADEARRLVDEVQRHAEAAQQRAAELEVLLTRYRERFGDVTEEKP